MQGFVVSVVNGCVILITAGTSWSHVLCPPQITRVKQLDLVRARGAPLLPGAEVSHSSNEPAALWSPARAVDHNRVTERGRYGVGGGKGSQKRVKAFLKMRLTFTVGLTTGPLWLHPGMMMMSWLQCLLSVNIRWVGTMPSAAAFNLDFESR